MSDNETGGSSIKYMSQTLCIKPGQSEQQRKIQFTGDVIAAAINMNENNLDVALTKRFIY